MILPKTPPVYLLVMTYNIDERLTDKHTAERNEKISERWKQIDETRAGGAEEYKVRTKLIKKHLKQFLLLLSENWLKVSKQLTPMMSLILSFDSHLMYSCIHHVLLACFLFYFNNCWWSHVQFSWGIHACMQHWRCGSAYITRYVVSPSYFYSTL